MFIQTIWNQNHLNFGNTTVCIYNFDNKYFIADNVNFSFETQGTNVTLRVSTSGTTNLSSLDEVRNYIKSMKMYYLKCKEFEKQLELTSDFTWINYGNYITLHDNDFV